ncbi:serine hydrolase domain-containing protein [Actinoallomurus iriomotensis]|nr:serine hydrolase domain-containing protein [Actinoallomurus iriomotensis]
MTGLAISTPTSPPAVADTRTGRPVSPDSRHRIGSITKTLTATAVLQQVAKGRIALDAPIGRYLPDLVPGERGRQITVRMPGAKWAYSNTNYVLAGLLPEKVTGEPAATYITEHVIRPAGLRHTYFPGTNPYIAGPRSRAYYPLYGLVDPPAEHSVGARSRTG